MGLINLYIGVGLVLSSIVINFASGEDKATNNLFSRRKTTYELHELLGTAGEDYPIYSSVPETSFKCTQRKPGYYADVDSQCQVFHICQEDGRHDSFLCPNGTLFNQNHFICDWWYNVDCSVAPSLYSLNELLFQQHPRTHLHSDKSHHISIANSGASSNTNSHTAASPTKSPASHNTAAAGFSLASRPESAASSSSSSSSTALGKQQTVTTSAAREPNRHLNGKTHTALTDAKQGGHHHHHPVVVVAPTTAVAPGVAPLVAVGSPADAKQQTYGSKAATISRMGGLGAPVRAKVEDTTELEGLLAFTEPMPTTMQPLNGDADELNSNTELSVSEQLALIGVDTQRTVTSKESALTELNAPAPFQGSYGKKTSAKPKAELAFSNKNNGRHPTVISGATNNNNNKARAEQALRNNKKPEEKSFVAYNSPSLTKYDSAQQVRIAPPSGAQVDKQLAALGANKPADVGVQTSAVVVTLSALSENNKDSVEYATTTPTTSPAANPAAISQESLDTTLAEETTESNLATTETVSFDALQSNSLNPARKPSDFVDPAAVPGLFEPPAILGLYFKVLANPSTLAEGINIAHSSNTTVLPINNQQPHLLASTSTMSPLSTSANVTEPPGYGFNISLSNNSVNSSSSSTSNGGTLISTLTSTTITAKSATTTSLPQTIIAGLVEEISPTTAATVQSEDSTASFTASLDANKPEEKRTLYEKLKPAIHKEVRPTAAVAAYGSRVAKSGNNNKTNKFYK